MINQLLDKKLEIKTQLLYPYHRSTTYKYKEYKERTFSNNEVLTQFEVLWFVEQIDNDIISADFTQEQNSSLKVRIIYQCIRYNVIDSIYKYLNKQKKIKKKIKYYEFIDENKLNGFKKQTIKYKDLLNYDFLKACIDHGYITLNEHFRTFYMNYFMNDLNKCILKKAKEMNKVLDENSLIQKNQFIQFTFKKYQKLLPIYPLKDAQKVNFTHLFDSVIKNNSIWHDLCDHYNKNYLLLFDIKPQVSSINLILQTTHYKEQIAIYLSCILKFIENHPEIPFKDMCSNPFNYDVYFDHNEKEDTFYATITQSPFIPIEIDIKRETISLKDINRYIALLVQTEKYFYELLESMFIIILYNEIKTLTKEAEIKP